VNPSSRSQIFFQKICALQGIAKQFPALAERNCFTIPLARRNFPEENSLVHRKTKGFPILSRLLTQSLDAGVAKPGQQPFSLSKEREKRLAEKRKSCRLAVGIAICLWQIA